MQRLRPSTTAVIVVDVQEKLAAAMPPAQLASLERSARILLEGARLLHAPVLVTEQYPKGLGRTLPAIAELLQTARAQSFEKLDFSSWDAAGFSDALTASGARAAVVIGMESHVCVYQTVRDLTAHGFQVHVPMDGVSSRQEDHREVGLKLCERAGAVRTTTESVVFDWLERAGSDEFKALSKLIR
ncbi:MAG TPA: isochorismatase family protein [Polyangiaceae bacterium]|nr:isochorismatase family protein [Polyangiaceae bacterium]